MSPVGHHLFRTWKDPPPTRTNSQESNTAGIIEIKAGALTSRRDHLSNEAQEASVASNTIATGTEEAVGAKAIGPEAGLSQGTAATVEVKSRTIIKVLHFTVHVTV